MKREHGVTLIELLVSLLIFTIVIALTLKFFTKQLTLTTSQSGISESSQEAMSTMETLRRDIETAGYGLPWNMAGTNYSEATSSSAAPYNDAPSNPPRAIIIDNANSYLVLKGSALNINKASKHWGVYDSSKIFHNGFSGSAAASDYTNLNRFVPDDNAIILIADNDRRIIGSGSNWSYKYNGSDFAPPPPPLLSFNHSYLVYGILNSTTSSPKAPFNRIDYYIKTPGKLPANCAAHTKILYRSIMKSSTGRFTSYPILDCVAGFHIRVGEFNGINRDTRIFWSSSPDDPNYDDYAKPPTGSTKASEERSRLKTVRVYLLVQNGKKDRNYDFRNSPYSSSSSYSFSDNDTSPPISDSFDLSAITDWQHYRWKLIKISAVPRNLN